MDETKHGLIIDLNLYRPGRDLKKYLDAGVDGFILRIGGPRAWIEGAWNYQEDTTYRDYFQQLVKLGVPVEKIGGYIIHNPFEEWRTDYNTHIDLLNQWTGGGFTPGYFILDHEISKCWRGGTEIVVTAPNLIGSLASVMDKMYKKFRRPVMLYTARWFIDQNGKADHITKLDNVNRPVSEGGPGKQWAMWYAWYLNAFDTKTYTNARQAITDLPTPTGTQTGNLLQCGSYSLWDLWQFTSKFKITGDAQGVDANVTFGTIAQYWESVGAGSITPPPPPPVDPPVNADLSEKLAALALRVAELERWRRS